MENALNLSESDRGLTGLKTPVTIVTLLLAEHITPVVTLNDVLVVVDN
jgi:hypothetical protein